MSEASAAVPGVPTGLRATRRALRAEKAQLLRWRRLLRARLDLAVAGFAPPEPLGAADWVGLPESRHDLPLPSDLLGAVAVVTPLDPVELMNRLRTFDRALQAYGADLDTALETSTEAVVRSMVHPVVVELPLERAQQEGAR